MERENQNSTNLTFEISAGILGCVTRNFTASLNRLPLRFNFPSLSAPFRTISTGEVKDKCPEKFANIISDFSATLMLNIQLSRLRI